MIELSFEESEKHQVAGACLKVIGVGGAGGNAVNSMIEGQDLENVEFIVANTDAQALNASLATHKVKLGAKVTKGLGAGSNPDIGRRAAEEDLDKIIDHLDNTDILFLTAGLGGGTGSGALPVIAAAARELGILTVAIVTKPFAFEGKRRLKHAEDAAKVLQEAVDTLIIVPNQKLLDLVDPKISMLNAFALSNNILKQAIKGISDIITKTGHINVDFADVKAIMKDMGMAIMGTGIARGNDRARQAAINAISSPLLENVSIKGAKGVLINITGNHELGLQEINEAASMVYEMVSQDANIILGSVIDESMNEDIMVTVIATGFEDAPVETKTFGASTLERSDKTQTHTLNDIVYQNHVQASAHSTEGATENSLEKFDAHDQSVSQTIDQAKTQLFSQHTSVDIAQDQKLYAAPILDGDNASLDMSDLDTPTFLRKKAEQEAQNKH